MFPGSEHTRRDVASQGAQRLAPNDLGGVGETSPREAPSKEGDTSTKSELNHIQSTTSYVGNHFIRDPGMFPPFNCPRPTMEGGQAALHA